MPVRPAMREPMALAVVAAAAVEVEVEVEAGRLQAVPADTAVQAVRAPTA